MVRRVAVTVSFFWHFRGDGVVPGRREEGADPQAQVRFREEVLPDRAPQRLRGDAGGGAEVPDVHRSPGESDEGDGGAAEGFPGEALIFTVGRLLLGAT